MKQYLLSIIFLFSLACNVGFGQQNCAADLSAEKGGLEDVIAQIDAEFEDKGKLKDLPNLFKPCVSKEELDNIKNTYLSLKFDAPQHQTYKTIIKKVLDDNKLLCVDFVNNIRKGGTNKNYVAELDDLLKEYEILKQKNIKANTYEGTPTEENYNILIQLKPLLGDCIVGEDLKKVQGLNNQIITEGFNGGKTKEFYANLRDVLNLNSELFKNKTVAIITVQDTSATPETPIIEEAIELKKPDSNILMYLFYVLLFVSIAANGYFLYDKLFNEKTTKQSNNMKKAPSSNNGVNMLRTQKLEKLEKENKDLKKENREIERDLNNAKGEIQNLKQETKQANKTVSARKEDKQKGKTPNRNDYEKVLFFASPTSNGEFLAKNGQNEVKSGASIYIFYVNGSEATFEFYNDPSTFQATINDPGNRIKPVCDANNAYNPDAKKITTKREERGKATLQNDKWKVTKKAKISYEA
jgi:hypothetical protein